MASPGELVRVVAETLGVPEAAVTQHDRNLVMAGRRTRGGRGRSAAKVTPADAAALLIAVAGSSYVKDTIETLDEFGSLKVHFNTIDRSYSRDVRQWQLEGLDLPHLQHLQESHRFLDAIQALIAAEADGTIERAKDKFFALPIKNRKKSFKFLSGAIKMYSPSNQASIHISTHNWTEGIFYNWDDGSRTGVENGPIGESTMTASSAHLRQTREFSLSTLIRIGACVGA